MTGSSKMHTVVSTSSAPKYSTHYTSQPNDPRPQGRAGGDGPCTQKEVITISARANQDSFSGQVEHTLKAALRAAHALGWKMVPREMRYEMGVAVPDEPINTFDEDWAIAWDATPSLIGEGG